MTERECDCCGSRLSFIWTDSHGIGACIHCGLPYVIYHYASKLEGGHRLDKPPECALNAEGFDLAKRYWNEKARRVFPAAYDMGILPGRGTSYSGATEEDCRLFGAWYKQNAKPATVPAESESEHGT